MPKKYSIERVSPTEGVVSVITTAGNKKYATDVIKYGECMDFVAKHQKELKVYKIARILHRKNAKRRFIASIYAEDKNEAIRFFDTELIVYEANADYQLLTGDWKMIAEFKVVNNVRGITTII